MTSSNKKSLVDFVAVVTLGILTICGCGFGALGGLGGTGTKYLCGLVVGVWLLFGAHWLGGATYLGLEVHLYTPVVVQLYLAVRGSLVSAPGRTIFNCALLCACSVVGAGGNSLFLNRPAIVDPFHLVSNHHASYRNQLNTHNVEL